MADRWQPDDDAVESARVLRPRIRRRAPHRRYRPPNADGDEVLDWTAAAARADLWFGSGTGCLGLIAGAVLGGIALIIRNVLKRA